MMGNIMDGFVSLLCGFIFVAAAIIMLAFPPKRINRLYGYRTSGSMKNKQRWDFAQKFSACRMLEAGVLMILISVALDYTNLTETARAIIEMVLLLASCAYMIAKTEVALKKKFPN